MANGNDIPDDRSSLDDFANQVDDQFGNTPDEEDQPQDNDDDSSSEEE
jgi:hypothetical protein